ncbi:hypothetical protein C8R46DRAFT_368488 [Mycena filopes]|nr:hypothetical protein C8R46DRAFT_368488 [Mycena filopes]
MRDPNKREPCASYPRSIRHRGGRVRLPPFSSSTCVAVSIVMREGRDDGVRGVGQGCRRRRCAGRGWSAGGVRRGTGTQIAGRDALGPWWRGRKALDVHARSCLQRSTRWGPAWRRCKMIYRGGGVLRAGDACMPTGRICGGARCKGLTCLVLLVAASQARVCCGGERLGIHVRPIPAEDLPGYLCRCGCPSSLHSRLRSQASTAAAPAQGVVPPFVFVSWSCPHT